MSKTRHSMFWLVLLVSVAALAVSGATWCAFLAGRETQKHQDQSKAKEPEQKAPGDPSADTIRILLYRSVYDLQDQLHKDEVELESLRSARAILEPYIKAGRLAIVPAQEQR